VHHTAILHAELADQRVARPPSSTQPRRRQAVFEPDPIIRLEPIEDPPDPFRLPVSKLCRAGTRTTKTNLLSS
jgi:hypothetical protein